jgi:hypothetical protein
MNGGKAPPWNETWTMLTCSKKYLVSMQFIPDATGTEISAHVLETQPLVKQ